MSMLVVAAAKDYAWLWFLLFIAAFLGVAFYLQLKRRKDLEQVAQAMGFQFQAAEEAMPDAGFHRLPIFNQSHKRSNFLRGRSALGDVFLADVRVGSGKNSYSQTVACFHLSGRQLPAFTLSPESFLHKIGAALGFKDINFDSNPVFSKSYLLRGQDEGAIREAFRLEVLQFFEKEKGWTVEADGEWLSVHRHARLVSPKDIRSFHEQAEEVARQFAPSRW